MKAVLANGAADTRADKHLLLTFLGVTVLLVGIVLFLPLKMGIWLPDALLGTKRTLATETIPDGHSFRVVQYWNHGGFYYSTEMVHTFPDGKVETQLLDTDDHKSWRIPLSVDVNRKFVTATLEGKHTCTFRW